MNTICLGQDRVKKAMSMTLMCVLIIQVLLLKILVVQTKQIFMIQQTSPEKNYLKMISCCC